MDNLKSESIALLAKWLEFCTRNKKISRNTVAMGIVVFDHLKRDCPVSRDEVISQGGEVSGARSGLGKILESYGIPASYLKEITTRQGHQDGQRLFEMFEWGNIFANCQSRNEMEYCLSLLIHCVSLPMIGLDAKT